METCCSIKFNNRRDLVIEEMKKEMGNLAKTEADIFPDSKVGNWMKLIWDLMEKPETSVASRIMNFISISMILLSTMGMCLNTISIVAGKQDKSITEQLLFAQKFPTFINVGTSLRPEVRGDFNIHGTKYF